MFINNKYLCNYLGEKDMLYEGDLQPNKYSNAVIRPTLKNVGKQDKSNWIVGVGASVVDRIKSKVGVIREKLAKVDIKIGNKESWDFDPNKPTSIDTQATRSAYGHWVAGESSDMNNYTLGDRPTDTPLAYLERQNQLQNTLGRKPTMEERTSINTLADYDAVRATGKTAVGHKTSESQRMQNEVLKLRENTIKLIQEREVNQSIEEAPPPLEDREKLKVVRTLDDAASSSFLKNSLTYPSELISSSSVPFVRYLPIPYAKNDFAEQGGFGKLLSGNTWKEMINFQGGGSGGAEGKGSPIYLPMTGSITQNTNPNWTQEDDVISKLTGNKDFSKFFDQRTLGDNIMGAGGVALDVLKGTTTRVLGEVAKASGELLGGDPVAAGLRRLGMQFNPFQERFFKDVSFRVYTFEHKFMPSNKAEAETVLNIIRRFQYYSLPELSGRHMMLLYPATWRIGFFNNTSRGIVRNENLPLLENCVMTLVGIVYGGGGSWSQLKNGEPVETTVSLQATELSIPTKNRMQLEVNELENPDSYDNIGEIKERANIMVKRTPYEKKEEQEEQ